MTSGSRRIPRRKQPSCREEERRTERSSARRQAVEGVAWGLRGDPSPACDAGPDVASAALNGIKDRPRREPSWGPRLERLSGRAARHALDSGPMKIYTRTGDDGTTGLFGGRRVSKTDARVEAYGSVDELNALLGVALASDASPALAWLRELLVSIQNDLFVLGADLATPRGEESSYLPRVQDEQVVELERAID